MLIAGAGGHAKEIIEVLLQNGEDDIILFDDVSPAKDKLFNRFKILHSLEEVKSLFKKNNNFIAGIGKPHSRKHICDKLISCGGQLASAISINAKISSLDTTIGNGVNIMQRVIIQPSVSIGDGCLINAGAIIHHDSVIGKFSEIAPSVTVTGNCNIGNYVFIGTGAIISPNIIIGDNAIVGAGSVVLKNIADGEKVTGIPAVGKKNTI